MRDVVDTFLGVACALHRRDTPSGLGDALRHPIRRCIEEHGAAQETGSRQHRLRLQGQVLRPVTKLPARLRLPSGAGAVVADPGLWRWSADAAQDVGGQREPVTAHASGSECTGGRYPENSLGVSARHRIPLHLQWPYRTREHPICAHRQRSALARPRLRQEVAGVLGRDFVITRIKRPVVLKGQPVAPHETSDQDIQWIRIVELELVPHPAQPRQEITEMDYDIKDGSIRMRVRAAVAGYTLLHWSVDCSPNHSLRDEKYRLWLSDPLTLYGVENAKLAPGYQTPRAAKQR